MPNNEMDYSLIHRTPDGNGKILVTTPGSPDKGSWETEAELKTYVNQDVVMQTDIVQSLGQQIDKVPSNKAVDDAINAINTRVTNIEETLMGENEVTVQYPDDGNYSSLMPNKVPLRALKFAEVPRFRGKSRAWNQLCGIPSSSASYSGNGITFTDNRDGSYTLQTDANGATADATIPITPMNITQGKAILLGGAPSNSSITTHRMLFSSVGINTYMSNGDDIYIINGDTTMLFLQVFAGDVVATPITFKPFIRDLNIIFQEYTTAQIVTLGMAGVLSVIPPLGQYNAYDAGSLVDTTVTGVEAIGRNLIDWSAITADAFVRSADGEVQSYGSGDVNATDYIPVVGGSSYFLGGYTSPNYGNSGAIYDINKNFIGTINHYTDLQPITIPANGAYVRLSLWLANFSDAENSAYFTLNSNPHAFTPYKTDIISLSEPVTLRSAGSVADELDVKSGVVTHKIYKKTFSASDSWELSGAGNFFLKISDMSQVYYTTQISLLAEYDYDNTNSSIDKTYWNNGGYIWVRDTSFNGDTSAFASAMAGKKLNYALATPTTESIDPVPDNFLEVEGGGTVETIQEQTPVIDNCLDVTYDIIPQ